MTNSGGLPIRETFEAYLRDKGKGPGGEGGNYRSDAERELDRFATWCAGVKPPYQTLKRGWDGIYIDPNDRDREPTIEDIQRQYDENGVNIFRSYARHLRRQEYTAGTTKTYYAYVSSWCGWCVKEGAIPLTIHLAEMDAAKAPLQDAVETGEKTTGSSQQVWTPEQRDALMRFCSRRVDNAMNRQDEADHGTPEYNDAKIQELTTLRDRAFVALIAYSGIRGAELLRDTDDPRRDGITWEDVNLDENVVTVLRKRQAVDTATLPHPVIHPLSQYKKALDPPSDEWPVFPTVDRRTLREVITEQAGRQTHTDDDRHPLLIALEHDHRPQSITVRSGRELVKRLSQHPDADIPGLDADDHRDFLQLHGARRGMGEVLVRTKGFAAAARFLDNSEEMVRERYSHIEAADQADEVTEALSETDSLVRNTNES